MVVAPIKTNSLALRTQDDIVLARHTIRKIVQELGFRLVDQTKIVTAVSELARNTVVHGGGGMLQWEMVSEAGNSGIRLIFSDEGPGIADIELAMKDGWSTGKGLGMGLSGSKRLVNDFKIESSAGAGTRVTIAKWK
jgi:serine/threonine-protein kinase RsbT